jgi:hypothetical protein
MQQGTIIIQKTKYYSFFQSKFGKKLVDKQKIDDAVFFSFYQF